MSVQWLPDGDSVIVSGNESLGIVTRDEDEWTICHEDKISHSKIITSVFAISEEIITTCSAEDSTIKIWRLNQDGCECLKELKLEAPPISILYDNKTKCLVMMDKSLNLGVLQKDFDKKSEEAPAALTVEEKAQSQILDEAGLNDDFDLEDVELNDEDMEALGDDVEIVSKKSSKQEEHKPEVHEPAQPSQ